MSQTGVYPGRPQICLLLVIIIPHVLADFASPNAANEETRLQRDLLQGHNKLPRPAARNHETTRVGIKIILQKLININDKKDDAMFSMKVEQSWTDVALAWRPSNYSNINSTFLQWDCIWNPEITLMEISHKVVSSKKLTMAKVNHDGLVTWSPTYRYKISCVIDAKYFPFDQQSCTMTFVAQSYDATEVQLFASENVDTRLLEEGDKWHVMDVILQESNASLMHSNVQMTVVLQRLPLYYFIFILLPCLGISLLTGIAFFLPSKVPEKLLMSVSMLLSYGFYALTMFEVLPSCSSGVPVITIYIIFNMVLITMSVTMMAILVGINHRGERTTSDLSPWLRHFLFVTAPKYLWLKVLDLENIEHESFELDAYDEAYELVQQVYTVIASEEYEKMPNHMLKNVKKAVKSSLFIVDNLKRKIHTKQEEEKWMYVGAVVDRLFFIIFMVVYAALAVVSVVFATTGGHLVDSYHD